MTDNQPALMQQMLVVPHDVGLNPDDPASVFELLATGRRDGLDGALITNLAAYLIDWQDLQGTVLGKAKLGIVPVDFAHLDNAGDAVVIFQPAEEGGAGAAAMIKDGLMDRFKIDQVYGMHNGPGLPLGSFAIRPGPIMAATDAIDFTIEGHGGHAARPHMCIDPVVAGSQLIVALQSIVSRNVDPLDSAVISVCEFEAGNARNVIPQTVVLRGTVRTLRPNVRDLVEKRIREITAGVAQTTADAVLEDRPLLPIGLVAIAALAGVWLV